MGSTLVRGNSVLAGKRDLADGNKNTEAKDEKVQGREAKIRYKE